MLLKTMVPPPPTHPQNKDTKVIHSITAQLFGPCHDIGAVKMMVPPTLWKQGHKGHSQHSYSVLVMT